MNNDYPVSGPELLKKKFKNEIVEENKNKLDQTIQRYSERQWGVYTPSDLLEVLGATIKQDNTNKILVFLAQLLSFTENDQLNLSFSAPSSSGKSYLALEIASLFPQDAVITLGYASPASFFHTQSIFDKDKKGFVVDLERKIVVFLDMPHPQLLEKLRPVLSHDQKEVHIKITDKQKSGIKTKDIFIIGHSSIIFCSAYSKFDEQELTRFLLLSPEVSQEKIRASIFEVIKKETDLLAYYETLNANPARKELKERIEAIRELKIKQINLHDPTKIMNMFCERNKIFKPRHSRDIKRLICIIKSFALLNLWNRTLIKTNSSITTTDQDYIWAFQLWDQIAIAQDLGLPPYLLNLYKEVIYKSYLDNNKAGITRQDILKKHYEVYGRHIQDFKLRQEYLPVLENSGLISQEKDEFDKRQVRIYPLVPLTIFSEAKSISKDIRKNGESKTVKSPEKEDDDFDDIYKSLEIADRKARIET
jgi:hypothetical protein